MNFEAALRELDAEFGGRTLDPLELVKLERVVIGSGGPTTILAASDTLCLDKARAVELWMHAVARELEVRRPKVWGVVGDLALDTWRITIADKRQTQRMSASRFSATATLAFGQRASTADRVEKAEKEIPGMTLSEDEIRRTIEEAQAKNLLLEAKADFENGRKVMTAQQFHTMAKDTDWPMNRCPTGEPFDMYASAGIKPEGETTLTYASVLEATHAFRATLMALKETAPGQIFWRQEPSIEFDGVSKWTVICRVCVSAKPANWTRL